MFPLGKNCKIKRHQNRQKTNLSKILQRIDIIDYYLFQAGNKNLDYKESDFQIPLGNNCFQDILCKTNHLFDLLKVGMCLLRMVSK